MKPSHVKLSVLLLVLIISLVQSRITPLSLKPPVASAQCTEMIDNEPVEVPCPEPSNPTVNENPSIPDPTGDGDGDGVANNVDNCPNVANADQLNTYGGSQGDACESADSNNGAGTQVFQESDTRYKVFGDCYVDGAGNTECQQIATLDVCSLPRTVGTSAVMPNPSAPPSTQQVLVTLMSNDPQGVVYQINVQDANGTNVGSPLNVNFSSLTVQACGDTGGDGVSEEFGDAFGANSNPFPIGEFFSAQSFLNNLLVMLFTAFLGSLTNALALLPPFLSEVFAGLIEAIIRIIQQLQGN